MNAVESKKLKYAKILVLGGPINAFHGVLKLPLYLSLILLISGCSWFADKRIVVKPPPVDSRDRWKALAPFVKNHFKTDMTINEIAAELAYAEYLLNKENPSSYP